MGRLSLRAVVPSVARAMADDHDVCPGKYEIDRFNSPRLRGADANLSVKQQVEQSPDCVGFHSRPSGQAVGVRMCRQEGIPSATLITTFSLTHVEYRPDHHPMMFLQTPLITLFISSVLPFPNPS